MINQFWNECISNMHWSQDAKYAGTICFGASADEARKAIDEIISGDRRAHIYPLNGYRCAMNGKAQPGQIHIVVDWQDMPCAAIETIAVKEIRLGALTEEICALDGAGMNLERWREERLPFIKTEIEELGDTLLDDTVLMVEEFRLIHSA